MNLKKDTKVIYVNGVNNHRDEAKETRDRIIQVLNDKYSRLSTNSIFNKNKELVIRAMLAMK